MFHSLASLLPPRVIRWIARLRYRLPVGGKVIEWVGRRIVARAGRIRYGLGRGLWFDASGGNPGFLLGTTEPLEQDALARHLAPGGYLYDVGANLGFFCVLAGRVVGPTGRVYAFEPHPEYAARIARNAGRNEFTNIEVIQAAVADAPGRMSLRVEGVPCPQLDEASFGPAEASIEVEVVTIDGVVALRGLRPPTYVIIDAEGAEVKVLTGMRETIRAHRPIILVEVHWLGQTFEEYIDRELRPIGYVLTNLEAGQPVPAGLVRYHALLTPFGPPAGG